MYRLRLMVFFLAVVAIFAFTSDAMAKKVAGVDVPDSISVGAGKDTIALNGAGIRKKFIIKVYVGALYLTKHASTVDQALSTPGAKRVFMHFVYKKVEAKKLNSGWEDGFRSNLSPKDFKTLEARLKTFKSFFPDMHKGDEILLDYVPGTGTEVRINGKLAGSIKGEDFYRALMLVWLGDVPADKGLKKGMLGG